MKIYIINLFDANDRKECTLKQVNSLKNKSDIIIGACDARKLTNTEIEEKFDIEKYKSRNLWMITKEEIACTFSHRMCYESLIKSGEEYGLILEDDIEIKRPIEKYIDYLKKILECDTPRIILLSGWFWYKRKKKLGEDIYICKIFDARLAHAYLINRAACKIILGESPWYIADHWRVFVEMGIEVYGLQPHPVDQIKDGKNISQIQKGKIGIYNFSFNIWCRLKWLGLKRRILLLKGNFEEKE